MVNLKDYLFVFIIAFLSSFLLTPLMRKIALKANITDKPGKRKIHRHKIPYLGGVAVYFSFIISIIIAFNLSQQFRMEFAPYIRGLLIAGTAISLLGLYDDIKGLRPWVKLSGQVLVALILFGYGFRIELITNPFGGDIFFSLPLSMVITVIWIVGLINAINLIDGLDGLAAGLTGISSIFLFMVAFSSSDIITVFLTLALVGCTLGFLRFNFHPAKIFLGDTGSMFLGMVLAVIAIRGFHKTVIATALLIPLIALSIPIYDIFMAVIRRLSGHISIFKADRRHLHHRLLDMGLNQRQAVLLLYFIGTYLGVFAFLFVLIPNEYAFVLLILLGMGGIFGIKTMSFIEKLIHKRYGYSKELRAKSKAQS